MADKFITEFLLAYLIEHKTIIITGALIIAKEALEYWLGRTDKVQAGSSLELIILFIKRIKNAIKPSN